MPSALPANSTNLCTFVLLLWFVFVFTATVSSQTRLWSVLWPSLYLLLLYCKMEGHHNRLLCKFCQWCECRCENFWLVPFRLSRPRLAHSFPSHSDAPTNPRGRNTVDRVQMDSLGIWQILEMDFAACQNKQFFSAWGSQRDGRRGLRWMVDRAELHVTLSLPRHWLQLPPQRI